VAASRRPQRHSEHSQSITQRAYSYISAAHPGPAVITGGTATVIRADT
jgi:hypothetical protein